MPVEEQRLSTESTDEPSNKRTSRIKDENEIIRMISRALGPENESKEGVKVRNIVH